MAAFCPQPVRLFFEDEARFGLHLPRYRRLTSRGVRPKQPVAPLYEYYWLYAAVEPKTGEHLFWEMPALDEARLNRRFECVVVDAPALAAVRADPRAFATALRSARDGVATFANLGGDATLIAPAPPPGGAESAYRHLTSFAREARPTEHNALWRAVVTAVRGRLGAEPLWISTSGLGVHWLHVRLDVRPKYYTHAPYRDPGYL